MSGELSAAQESRRLFNHLREAHAKLEVIIDSDDATAHFVGRVAFVFQEEALLVNVTTESFATFRVWPRLNQLRALENFSTAKLPQAIATDFANAPDKIFAFRFNSGGLLVISRKAAAKQLAFVVAIPPATGRCTRSLWQKLSFERSHSLAKWSTPRSVPMTSGRVSWQDLAMRLSFVQPRIELHPYIESFWVFESPAGMPPTDTSMAAPNGCPKLIIPYENSLVSIADGRTSISHEGGLYFVGNRDTQTHIHSTARETSFVVVEFSPHGAFPFFGIPMAETVSGLFDSEVLFGKWGREVRESLRNLEEVDQKVNFIQEQLVALLRGPARHNALVEFCVGALRSTGGRFTIGELERRTGYSRRYLDLLFKRHVGLSPKVLAGIFRFQTFYRKWARGLPYEVLKEDLYDYYYDQAHFIKEFKRMTGYSPRQYTLGVSNEFGRRISLTQQFPFLQ